MDKKGFITIDTFTNIGFWILVLLGWSATIIGWKVSQGMDGGGLPLWQIIITLIVIFIAAAFFVRE